MSNTASVSEDDLPPVSDLHSHVITSLRTMVMRGELPEGCRVPEAMLCARLSISRTPLREALKVLASEGFVALRPNRGAVVVPIDRHAVSELFELKGALEHWIGLSIPGRISKSERQRVEATHHELAEAMETDDNERYTQLNHDFHAALAAATHNAALVQTYTGLQQKILRARYAINEEPAQLRRSMADHDDIMAMLRAGAARDLAHRLEEHNRRTGEAVIRQLHLREEAYTVGQKGRLR